VTSVVLLAAAACLAWALLLRRRLVRVADAEHEVRGALTALGLAVQRQGDAGLTAAYEGQLARVRAALGAGSAERCSLDGLLAGATVPAGGAVVLGNLVANAVEHGEGPVAVRIEVANSHGERRRGRGRGLRIAERAARAAGGRLDVRDDGGRFAAVVELPVER
jgi:hypothetical protein